MVLGRLDFFKISGDFSGTFSNAETGGSVLFSVEQRRSAAKQHLRVRARKVPLCGFWIRPNTAVIQIPQPRQHRKAGHRVFLESFLRFSVSLNILPVFESAQAHSRYVFSR